MIKVVRSSTARTIARTIIICSIYGVVLILLYIFAARPISHYSKRLREELFSQSRKIKEYEDLIKAYPNPEREIEEIMKKTQELKDRVGGREQLPRIIQQLVGKISELNINLISIRPKPREEIRTFEEKLIAGVSKVYIEIVMTSSYQLVGEYLKALPELPIILTVEGLSIQGTQEVSAETISPEADELLITLLLSAYVVLEI